MQFCIGMRCVCAVLCLVRAITAKEKTKIKILKKRNQRVVVPKKVLEEEVIPNRKYDLQGMWKPSSAKDIGIAKWFDT